MNTNRFKLTRAAIALLMLVGMFGFVGGQALAAGVSSRVVVLVNVPANGSASATATCPSATLRTGGGWYGIYTLSVRNDMPTGSNGWMASAQNTSNAANTLAVFAVCLSGVNGAVSIVQSAAITAMSGQVKAATTASCLLGSSISGGGFQTSGTDVRVSKPNGATWETDVWNTGPGTVIFTSYGVCLSGGSVSVHNKLQSLGGGTDQAVTANCEPGEAETGGGFSSQIIASTGSDQLLIHGSYPGPLPTGIPNTWYAYARNSYSFAQSVTAYAVCEH